MAFAGWRHAVVGGVIAVVIFGITGAANAVEAGDEALFFRQMVEQVEVSCDTMMAAQYPGEDFFVEGKPVMQTFDRRKCAERLQPKPLAHYVSSLLEMMTSQQHVEIGQPNDKSEMEAGEKKLRHLIEKVRRMSAPIIEACRNAASRTPDDLSFACYFGAPKNSENGAAVASFRAMASNSMPNNEALCTGEGHLPDLQKVPEFKSFMRNGETRLQWEHVKQDLQVGGFTCPEAWGNNGTQCIKTVLEVVFPSQKLRTDPEKSDECILRSSDAVLMLRQLTVYKGEWHVLGPPSFHCRIPLNKSESTTIGCDLTPKRGTNSGICMKGEDWHIWGAMLPLLNPCETADP
jgi:hypothetical protein